MSPRSGNASAEKQFAVFVVKHRLTGCSPSETFCFNTAIVSQHRYTGNICCRLPEIGLLPAIWKPGRFVEQDVCGNFALAMRHQDCQFDYGSSRAGTMWVSQKNKRRLTLLTLYLGMAWPFAGLRGCGGSGSFVCP